MSSPTPPADIAACHIVPLAGSSRSFPSLQEAEEHIQAEERPAVVVVVPVEGDPLLMLGGRVQWPTEAFLGLGDPQLGEAEIEELTNDQILGMQIRAARLAAGWSQLRLATALGHAQSWLVAIEAGTYRVNVELLFAVAAVLEIAPITLMGRVLERAMRRPAVAMIASSPSA